MREQPQDLPAHRTRRVVTSGLLYALAASALAWSVVQIHDISGGRDFEPDPHAPVFVAGQGRNVNPDIIRTRSDWLGALRSFNSGQVKGVAYHSETGSKVPATDRRGVVTNVTTPFDNVYCQPGFGTLGGNGQVYFQVEIPERETQARLDSYFKTVGYARASSKQEGKALRSVYTRKTQLLPATGDIYDANLNAPFGSLKQGRVSSVSNTWQVSAVISPTMVQLTLPHEPCYRQGQVPKGKSYTVEDLTHVLDDYRWLPGYSAQSFDDVS